MFPLRDSEKSESPAIVVLLIIALNVWAFFHQISLTDYELDAFLRTYGTVPRRFKVADLFTSMFLHGGWMHLVGNLWFLWVFGDNVEDILGHASFLVFYLACGVAGGVAHVLANPDSTVPAIGASGAISGVMGAYLLKFPRSRVTTLIFFLLTIEVPALLMIGYWFLTQLLSGFGSLASADPNSGGTAWFAHIGGFAAGCVLIQILPTKPRWNVRRNYEW
jgi:membrane associated rhomboid family serine protease